MKSNITFAIVGGVLLTAAMTSPALAATYKPSQMTCEDFLQIDDIVKPKLVYFAEGNNKGSHPGEFKVEEIDHIIPILIEDCHKTPKANLVKKMKEVKKGG